MEMIWILVVLFAVAGAAIGSFIGVVEHRSRRGESFVFAQKDHAVKSAGASRSYCEDCGKQLAWYELLPVISFVVQRGRCRGCGVRLPWEYLVLEVIGACIPVLTAFGLQWFPVANQSIDTWVVYSIYGWVLFAIFWIDLKQQIIPDGTTLPASLFALFVGTQALQHDARSLLLGMVIAAGFFAVQFFVSRGKWIGGGDIRLGALMGVMLGAKATVVALFLAYILGAIVAAYLLATKRAQKNTQIAFGTFLTIATFISLFVGESIADWYLIALGL